MDISNKKIGKKGLIATFFALWLTFAFKNAYSNGLAFRMISESGLTAAIEMTPAIVVFMYVFAGLLSAVLCFVACLFVYSVVQRASFRQFIVREEFCTLVFFAVSISNIVTGGVLWFSYIEPVMYPFLNSILDLVVLTASLSVVCAYILKKYVPRAAAANVFLAMVWPYLTFFVINYVSLFL